LILLNCFRKNAGVTDPRVIELLLDNGRMEIEETMQQWKQKPHIMAILEPEIEPVDPWEPEEFQKLCVPLLHSALCGCFGKFTDQSLPQQPYTFPPPPPPPPFFPPPTFMGGKKFLNLVLGNTFPPPPTSPHIFPP